MPLVPALASMMTAATSFGPLSSIASATACGCPACRTRCPVAAFRMGIGRRRAAGRVPPEMRQASTWLDRASIARHCHRRVAGAVVGTIARDHPALGFAAASRANLTACSLASAPPSVKNTRPSWKPDFCSSNSASSARGSAPQALVDETQLGRLRADGFHHARMLVTEVAAFGKAAHVQDLAAVGS